MLTRLALVLLSVAVPGIGAENSPYYSPIRDNDLAQLQKLIRDPGPKVRDGRGNSPLMYAAALGSLDSLRMLLDAGADPNVANDFGATPLMWCAGDAAKVRLLIAKGANVNARSKLGRTPLLISAAYDGALDAAKLLIEKGADVKAADEGGMTVLQQAASSNHIELVRLLLSKGAKAQTVDGGGYTPLIQAASSGDRSGPLVKLLLEHGADSNSRSGDTAEMVKNGPVAIGHITALHMAAEQGDYEAAAALVTAGADVNAPDIRGATPLVFAVATDHANPKIVKLLLDKGAMREAAIPWARKYQDPAILSLVGLSPEKVAGPVMLAKPRYELREAIEKALMVSREPARRMLETGGCLACHAQHLNGLAVAAAKPLGIKADYQLEAKEAQATATLRGSIEQQLFQLQDPPPGVDSQQFSLMQMAGSQVAPSLATDSMLHHITGMQRKEGDWPNYGTARPPIEDGGFSHTAKGIRVLRLYPIAGRKAEFDERIARAVAFLEHAEPRTTEDRTMQILGLAWAGRKGPAERVKQLIALQRPEGGWSQTPNLAADSYATGEALWALHEAGMAGSDPVYRRGVDFLLRTQEADGSWHVKTRALAFQPYFQSGFPYDHDQWISQTGTAFATIALTFAK